MVEISHITKNENLYVHITAITVHVELVIANQKRQTNWLTDYHANYKKKLEEHRNAVISEAEKEKTD